MFAALNGHPATIKLLLEAGADLALTSRGGRTARGYAELRQQAAAEARQRVAEAHRRLYA